MSEVISEKAFSTLVNEYSNMLHLMLGQQLGDFYNRSIAAMAEKGILNFKLYYTGRAIYYFRSQSNMPVFMNETAFDFWYSEPKGAIKGTISGEGVTHDGKHVSLHVALNFGEKVGWYVTEYFPKSKVIVELLGVRVGGADYGNIEVSGQSPSEMSYKWELNGN